MLFAPIEFLLHEKKEKPFKKLKFILIFGQIEAIYLRLNCPASSYAIKLRKMFNKKKEEERKRNRTTTASTTKATSSTTTATAATPFTIKKMCSFSCPLARVYV